jgi:hypothetical protein
VAFCISKAAPSSTLRIAIRRSISGALLPSTLSRWKNRRIPLTRPEQPATILLLPHWLLAPRLLRYPRYRLIQIDPLYSSHRPRECDMVRIAVIN